MKKIFLLLTLLIAALPSLAAMYEVRMWGSEERQFALSYVAKNVYQYDFGELQTTDSGWGSGNLIEKPDDESGWVWLKGDFHVYADGMLHKVNASGENFTINDGFQFQYITLYLTHEDSANEPGYMLQFTKDNPNIVSLEPTSTILEVWPNNATTIYNNLPSYYVGSSGWGERRAEFVKTSDDQYRIDFGKEITIANDNEHFIFIIDGKYLGGVNTATTTTAEDGSTATTYTSRSDMANNTWYDLSEGTGDVYLPAGFTFRYITINNNRVIFEKSLNSYYFYQYTWENTALSNALYGAESSGTHRKKMEQVSDNDSETIYEIDLGGIVAVNHGEEFRILYDGLNPRYCCVDNVNTWIKADVNYNRMGYVDAPYRVRKIQLKVEKSTGDHYVMFATDAEQQFGSELYVLGADAGATLQSAVARFKTRKVEENPYPLFARVNSTTWELDFGEAITIPANEETKLALMPIDESGDNVYNANYFGYDGAPAWVFKGGFTVTSTNIDNWVRNNANTITINSASDFTFRSIRLTVNPDFDQSAEVSESNWRYRLNFVNEENATPAYLFHFYWNNDPVSNAANFGDYCTGDHMTRFVDASATYGAGVYEIDFGKTITSSQYNEPFNIYAYNSVADTYERYACNITKADTWVSAVKDAAESRASQLTFSKILLKVTEDATTGEKTIYVNYSNGEMPKGSDYALHMSFDSNRNSFWNGLLSSGWPLVEEVEGNSNSKKVIFQPTKDEDIYEIDFGKSITIGEAGQEEVFFNYRNAEGTWNPSMPGDFVVTAANVDRYNTVLNGSDNGTDDYIYLQSGLTIRKIFLKVQRNEAGEVIGYGLNFATGTDNIDLKKHLLYMWHGEPEEALVGSPVVIEYNNGQMHAGFQSHLVNENDNITGEENIELYEIDLGKQVEVKYVIQLCLSTYNYSIWNDYRFNARQTGVFIDANHKDEAPYDGNSKIKAGLKFRTIFLRVDNKGTDDHGDDTYQIYLSEGTSIDMEAGEQAAYDTKDYALSIGKEGTNRGELYDALKATDTDELLIPFGQHAGNEKIHELNLGRTITTTKEERLDLVIDGNVSGKGATISVANTYVKLEDGEIVVPAGISYSRILLQVSGENNDNYQIYFANGETPEDFNLSRYHKVPALKVWRNGDDNDPNFSGGLFNLDGRAHNGESGTVRYYDFTAVEGNPNVFYMNFSEPVYVNSMWNNRVHIDRFNIMDEDGYDVAIGQQGGQFFYANKWWGANPRMMNDDGTFVKTPFQVPTIGDLGYAEGVNTKMTQAIYGITIFKIIGKKFDTYAQTVVNSNIYYVYFNTDPERYNGQTLPYEMTCPIVLNVFDKDAAKITETPEIYNYDAENDSFAESTFFAADAAGNATVTTGTAEEPVTVYHTNNVAPKFYGSSNSLQVMLRDSEQGGKNSEAQSDRFALYYVDFKNNIYPSDCQMEFVDVTGTQKWPANFGNDALRPNKLSNYYTGRWVNTSAIATVALTDDITKAMGATNDLHINNDGAPSYRVVLETTPDQARFMIQNPLSNLTSVPDNEYLPTTEETNQDNSSRVIYPGSDLSWNNLHLSGKDLYNKVTYTIGEQTYTTYVKVPYPSAEDIAELQANPVDESLQLEGEVVAPFELGQILLDPYAASTFQVEAIYVTEGTEVDLTAADPFAEVNDKSVFPSGEEDILTEIPVAEMGGITADNLKRGSEGNAGYKADIVWTPAEENDYPRYYSAQRQDVTPGAENTEEVVVHSSTLNYGGATGDEVRYYSEGSEELTFTEAPYMVTGATPWWTTDGDVTIEYEATMTYTFAYPSGQPQLVGTDVTLTDGDYATAKEGYTVTKDTSGAVTTTAAFNSNTTTTGVDDVVSQDVEIYAENRTLYIVGTYMEAGVYAASGALIYAGCDREISLDAAGVYIVRVGSIVKKISIR